jgi:hypothetical protein
MRRLLGVLLALALALPAASASAQPACEFKLGFRMIAAQIPGIVGQCLENEHHNPANGDALQRTTGGLLVWRKADNFTAFTDGHRSWVNGPFGLQVRLNTARFAWEAAAPAAAPAGACATVGTERCLPVDPRLMGAVEALLGVDEGRFLLRAAARGGVVLRVEPLPEGVHGVYRTRTRTIGMSAALAGASDKVKAAILAHELRHAVDHVNGTLGETEASCLKSEEDAFRVQARVWAEMWQGRLPPSDDPMHEELNVIAVAAARDPVGLAEALAGAYHEECRVFGP